jgi:hypothetical protein
MSHNPQINFKRSREERSILEENYNNFLGE